jgi:multicomponent Na+:H+ antiporter subunit D
MAKVWNRAFWRAIPETGVPAINPLVVRRRRIVLPRGMVVTAAVLVLVGLSITFAAGPLYGYAQRSATDMLDGTPYVSAVLPEGIR